MKETIGWGPWKKIWYSLCSRHRKSDTNCNMCKAGYYTNDWRHFLSSLVFKILPSFWIWWVNRDNEYYKRNKKTNR
jgi:hypothetical protein